ncbi:hypothetical protein NKH18_42005 [Streptomyces sp. M10(2022)]
MVRQHTVYCGVYPVASVRDVLLDVFGSSEEDHDGRVDGDSALLAFEVTDEGLLVQDSITFSACAWAVGRSRKPGPGAQGWLDGFETEADACEGVVLGVGDGKLTIADSASGRRQRPFAGLLCEITVGAVGGALNAALGPVLGDLAVGALSGAVDAVADGGAGRSATGEDEVSLDESPLDEGDAADAGDDDDAPPQLGEKPLTVRDLSAVTRWVAEQFGVTDDLRPETIRVQCKSVSRRKSGRSGGSDFLNSFIAADLDLVAGNLGKDDPGPALRDYLTASTALRGRARVDLKHELGAVLDGVQPAHFSLGRWPAKTEHPLVLSQQFAVNRIVEQLAETDGLYAVNGPPGTGKTTQLRDLIASVLVMRAERLSELRRPEDAFTGQAHRWSTGTYQRSVASLKPELAGYEMVIASANNGAVENVSNEIPALESVAAEWQEQASYFPEQGRLVLDGVPAWGPSPRSSATRATGRSSAASTGSARPRERAERGEGMRDLLKAAASRGGDPAAWRESVARFRDARRTVRALQDERQRASEALLDFRDSHAAVTTAQEKVLSAEQDLDGLRQPAAEARAARDRAQSDLAGPAGRRAEHRRNRPGLVAGIFTLGGRSAPGRRRTSCWPRRSRQLGPRTRHTRRRPPRTTGPRRPAGCPRRSPAGARRGGRAPRATPGHLAGSCRSLGHLRSGP